MNDLHCVDIVILLYCFFLAIYRRLTVNNRSRKSPIAYELSNSNKPRLKNDSATEAAQVH